MRSFREYLKEETDKITIYRGIRDYHQKKTKGTGLWFSTSKLVAATYSKGEIVSKTINVQNAKIIDCKGQFFGQVNTDKLAREYKDFDMIILKNIIDIGPYFIDAKEKYIKSADEGNIKDFFRKHFTADTVIINNPDLLKDN